MSNISTGGIHGRIDRNKQDVVVNVEGNSVLLKKVIENLKTKGGGLYYLEAGEIEGKVAGWYLVENKDNPAETLLDGPYLFDEKSGDVSDIRLYNGDEYITAEKYGKTIKLYLTDEFEESYEGSSFVALSALAGKLLNVKIEAEKARAEAKEADLDKRIDDLNVDDTAVAHQFVTEVDESAGFINVKRAALIKEDIPIIEQSQVNNLPNRLTGIEASISTEAIIRENADNALRKRIDDLDYTDTSEEHKFVTKVDESAGIISVTRSALVKEDIPTIEQSQVNNLPSSLNSKLNISDIINDVTTTTTNQALSANMGKELQDQINNLKAIGRFLSIWNCVTGLPTTDPTVQIYDYKTGDYYVVGTISESSEQVNYKPDGSTYTKRVPSTTIETLEVAISDYYVYDGSVWKLLSNTQKTITFANIAGNPYDNTNLSTALNDKVTKNNTIEGATHTKITYDSKGLVTGGSDLVESDIPALHLTKITDVTATKDDVNALASASRSNDKYLHTNSSTGALEWAEAGKVDDVKVDGTSVVTNKVANIDLTGKQNKITFSVTQPLTPANGDFWYEDTTLTLLPVGGRIFYIHNDNGATYHFFDAGGNELTTQTVEGLATATQYAVVGTPTADKFYVFNNSFETDMCWGLSSTIVLGTTTDGIGRGKIDTSAALAITGWEDNSIWTYIQTLRANRIGNCDDWYIPSKAECSELITTGLASFLAPRSSAPWYIFYVSTESPYVELAFNRVWHYQAGGGSAGWSDNGPKTKTTQVNFRTCCFAIRSF